MVTTTEYALLAGASYIASRNPINQLPMPNDWSKVDYFADTNSPSSGFEAATYFNGTDYVISYAGTNDNDFSGDLLTDLNLGLFGKVTEQLKLAAKYYINTLKAHPDANILFTGHSLGGGLAALMAVYFNKTAVTFDQAPFRNAVSFESAVILRNYLEDEFPDTDATNANIQNWLNPLSSIVNGGSSLINSILYDREQAITNTNVQNEFLSKWLIINLFSSRIGISALSDPLGHGSVDLPAITLHSQALLIALLTNKEFQDVTFVLSDLLPMIFSDNLYNNRTSPPNLENFIERLVRHEFGNAPVITSADLMLSRFTHDLQKIAQNDGLTLKEFTWRASVESGIPEIFTAPLIGDTLIAFAMQKYYTETNWNALPILFSDVPGGIQFDRNDVASTLNNAKGYNLFFKTYIEKIFSSNEQASINSILPNLRDWYVQAGLNALDATDTLNRGAFMLGGDGNDKLTGGNQADLLIGNDGFDILNGGNGNDVLISHDNIGLEILNGGADYDAYFADSSTTIIDSDGHGRISFDNILLNGGSFVKGADVYKSSDGKVFYQPSANGMTAYMNASQGSSPQGAQQLNIQAPLSPPSTDTSGTTTSGMPGMGISLTKKEKDPQDPQTPEPLREAQQYVPPRRDPLTFDLDGDGLETTGIDATNPILFDHDGDGIKTATGWVKADDAFLVRDRNGNGSIDNGAELFGDNTPLAAGGKAVDGFAALADLDSNQDGKISSADTQFANLRLWRNLNQNGVSDTGELFTLNTLGIASINVTKQINSQVLPDGNRIADLGTYTRMDGSLGGLGETSLLGDIDLVENTFFRTFASPLDTTAVAGLPDMQGSGQIRDLREAATLSPTLTQLLTSFAADTAYSGQKAKLDAIVKAWADTSTMQATFTGAFNGHPLNVSFAGITNGSPAYQAWMEKLTTIERFIGQTFRPVPIGTDAVNINLATEQLTLLQQSYDIIKESVYGSLVMQTRLKPFLDLITFTVDSTAAYIDFTATKNALQAGINANAAAGMANLLDFEKFAGKELRDSGWDGTDLIISNLISLPITPALQAVYDDYGARTGSAGTDQNDFLLGNNLDNTLDGKNGDDFLFGSSGNDTLSGGAGNDMLVGGVGNDVLNGGIAGGYGIGNDTYQFSVGSGQDIINDYDSTLGSVDKIQLGAGILPGDVSVSRNGNDLILKFATATDQLAVANWYSSPDYRIEQLSFANGTVWDQADLYNKGNLSFAPVVDYAVGERSIAITAGDFNNDGKLDLAIANDLGNKVSVLLRNAENTGFDPKVDYAAGTYPTSISAADFNGDGKLDLALGAGTVSRDPGSISVLLHSASNFDFDPKTVLDLGMSAANLAISTGDFNGDGKIDLAAASYDLYSVNGTVSVFMRNAENTGFDTKVDYGSFTYKTPYDICTGDFNGDGKLDLATANVKADGTNTVAVFLRNATNTGFDPEVDYATGRDPRDIEIGDLNNDGLLDLAVSNWSGHTISVLLRNAANTGFDPKIDYVVGNDVHIPISISKGDFNSDGKLDLAVANLGYYTDSFVSVLQNDSNTTPTITSDRSTTDFTGQAPVVVANTITIHDVDGNADWNGGMLRVQISSNASTNDNLLLPTANNGGIWLNTTGNILMANTTAIGTTDAAFVTGGAAWTLTFNSAATNALVQSTAQAIQFNNASGSPSTADRTVTFTAMDKNTGYDTAVQTIKVTIVNHNPTVIAPLVDQAVQTGTLGWSYNPSAAFSDEDAGDTLSYSATLANGNPLPAWILMDATTGVLTGSPSVSDRGSYALIVKATDTHGSSVSTPLTVAATAFNAGKLLVSTAGNDVLAGTVSNDTVTYAFATAPVTVSLATTTQQNTLGAGLDTLTNINNLIGSNFNDTLTGNGQKTPWMAEPVAIRSMALVVRIP